MAHLADQHAITLVLDPDDDLLSLRLLRSLHARPFGQIVCEPATSATNELAHDLLGALGKTVGDSAGAWRRAQAVLRAEQIEHIVLLRGHVLTYPALRRLADTAATTSSRLWIIAVGEIPTAPIRQLLEQRPHSTAAIEQVLAELALSSRDDEHELPSDHGPDFPLLAAADHRRGRGDLLRGLRGSPRTTVGEAFDETHAWMIAWLDQDPNAHDQEVADAIYQVAAAASTASETLVRAHACITALADHGIVIRPNTLDDLQRDRWHENRPAQHHHDIARAAAIADRCPDPAEAALIALSAITRCSYTLRYLTVGRIAESASGAVLHGNCITGVPPQLRPALRAQRELWGGLGPQTPLLTGLGKARPNKQTMLRCYEQHRVPARLRAVLDNAPDEDDIDETLGDDGREILFRLHPANIFKY